LGLPHVQIEGIVEAHNFGSQTFAIKDRLSLRFCTERSCCPELREYLSSWVEVLDLWRASWSSLEVLDELIPKVSSLALISCVNNKLQNRHASVNLLHH
jgi:hypothetical protein